MCVYKTYIPPINFFHLPSYTHTYTHTHTQTPTPTRVHVRVCIYNFQL